MRLVEHFFRILAPANCVACGSEGSPLCEWCSEQALPEVLPRCYRCNKLSPDSRTCTACRRKSAVSHLWSRTEYTDSARKIIHLMKFKYSAEAADLIAKELVNTLPALSPEYVVVHVPAATTHVRQRGFDHAARIARGLSRRTALPHLALLSRQGQLRQVGASRRTRLEQMRDVFYIKRPQDLLGARVLLVDDVLTTGATIEAAASVLKEAGARSVDAVVFARAL